MKKISLHIILGFASLLLTTMVSAQNMSINANGSKPDSSAMLDVKSTTQGFLMPRMTQAERDAISNPAHALLIYQTDNESGIYAYDSVGGAWNITSDTLSILTDADGDTRVQVEESADDDIIRFDMAGVEYFRMDSGRLEVTNTGSSVFIGQGAGANDDLTSNVNTFIGYLAGNDNTSGATNVFIGASAGANSSTTNASTYVGNSAGFNSNGAVNTMIGAQSGYSNTTGIGNAFLGYSTGYANTTGSYNTFIGYQSGDANTTGSNNFFAGYLSGATSAALTGGDNVAIGHFTGTDLTTGQYNIFFGPSAGENTTTGISNIYMGRQSGSINTTGSYNTGIGYQAGRYNTTGQYNVSVGYQAGYWNTTGQSNVNIGRLAGYNITTAFYNTNVGFQAGYDNQTANYNTNIGYRAGMNSTSTGNVNVGMEAGFFNETGAYNTTLGYQAGRGATGASTSGSVYLGRGAGYSDTIDNRLWINNEIDITTPLIWGDFTNHFIAIGTTTMIGSSQMTLSRATTGYSGIYVNTSAGGEPFYGYSTGGTATAWTYTDGGDSDKWKLYVAGADRMTVTNTGLVGIGTTTPSSPLEVNTTSNNILELNATSGNGYLLHQVAAGSFAFTLYREGVTNRVSVGMDGSDDSYRVYMGNISGTPLITGTTGADVGINNASPSVPLQVDGGGDLSLAGGGYFMTNTATALNIVMDDNEIQARNNGSASPLYMQNDGGDFYIHNALNDTTRFRITSDGKVSVGTATLFPGAQLSVSGRIYFGSAEYIEDGGANTTTSSASIVPSVNGTRSLGNTTFRWNTLFATNGTINTSDRRDKDNITDLEYGLDEVLLMQPVTYQWKNLRHEGTKVGLIAQDVLEVVPEAVMTKYWEQNEETGEWYSTDADRLGINYSELTPVLIKAIQEQNEQIEALRNEVESLQNEVDELKTD